MRSLDNLEDKVDSKFRFVLLAARRAEQLTRGAEPRVEVTTAKVAWTAMDELIDEKIQWGYGAAPEDQVETESDSDEVEESDETEVH